MKQQNKFFSFLEGSVFVAIVLVLTHTLVQDFADLYGWSWGVRRTLIYVGFGFDLFFTIEFLSRLMTSLLRGKVLHYLRDRRGWIDFAAAVPLLLFTSGPEAFSAYYDVPTAASVFGVFGVLKVVKVIRIARILRLLRLLKLFKHIRHVDSVMAQRHISRVATMSVATIVVCLVAFSLFTTYVNIPNLERSFEEYTIEVLDNTIDSDFTAPEAEQIAAIRPDILIIRSTGGDEVLYTRHPNAYYDFYYGPSDYTLVTYPQHDIEVFVDLMPLISNSARNDMLHFFIIVTLVVMLLFVYGPHFAATVSDPVQIMARGFSQKGYTLQVLPSKRFKNDEVYVLAEKYNDIYLPLKDREGDGSHDSAVVDIDIEDVKDFLG